MIQKHRKLGKICFDLCDLDLYLWPWPFACISLLSIVITPENFMMIGRGDGQMDGQKDGLNHSESCLVTAKKKKHHNLTFQNHILTLMSLFALPYITFTLILFQSCIACNGMIHKSATDSKINECEFYHCLCTHFHGKKTTNLSYF